MAFEGREGEKENRRRGLYVSGEGGRNRKWRTRAKRSSSLQHRIFEGPSSCQRSSEAVSAKNPSLTLFITHIMIATPTPVRHVQFPRILARESTQYDALPFIIRQKGPLARLQHQK